MDVNGICASQPTPTARSRSGCSQKKLWLWSTEQKAGLEAATVHSSFAQMRMEREDKVIEMSSFEMNNKMFF